MRIRKDAMCRKFHHPKLTFLMCPFCVHVNKNGKGHREKVVCWPNVGYRRKCQRCGGWWVNLYISNDDSSPGRFLGCMEYDDATA